MNVWSHKLCRWVPWSGSRHAWLTLPHVALITGVCMVHTMPNDQLPNTPRTIVSAALRSSPVRTSDVPMDVLLPKPWLMPSGYISPVPYPAVVITDEPTTSQFENPEFGHLSTAPTPVPEPGNLPIFATAVVLLVGIKHMKRARLRPGWRASEAPHRQPLLRVPQPRPRRN